MGKPRTVQWINATAFASEPRVHWAAAPVDAWIVCADGHQTRPAPGDTAGLAAWGAAIRDRAGESPVHLALPADLGAGGFLAPWPAWLAYARELVTAVPGVRSVLLDAESYDHEGGLTTAQAWAALSEPAARARELREALGLPIGMALDWGAWGRLPNLAAWLVATVTRGSWLWIEDPYSVGRRDYERLALRVRAALPAARICLGLAPEWASWGAGSMREWRPGRYERELREILVVADAAGIYCAGSYWRTGANRVEQAAVLARVRRT